MQRYRDLSGNSGVHAFAIDGDHIIVRFKDDGTYLYDAHRPGLVHVRHMQQLAVEGKGLATYINRYVRDGYARKLA